MNENNILAPETPFPDGALPGVSAIVLAGTDGAFFSRNSSLPARGHGAGHDRRYMTLPEALQL